MEVLYAFYFIDRRNCGAFIIMASDIKKLVLNDLPSESDFEDFISANLLLGGFTLDRSIHEKVEGAGEIFEVDIVTHKYTSKDDRRLVEIKSKKWEIGDVFKVGGWIRYLGIDSGVFVVQQRIDEKKFSSWQSKLKRIGVSLVYAGKHHKAATKLDLTELFSEFGIKGNSIDGAMLEAIRFSFTAERCMRRRVSQLFKSQCKPGLKALLDFSNAIQDISFCDEKPIQRLHKTFEVYKEFNHLSARLDYELLHNRFPTAEEVTQFEGTRVRDYLLNTVDYVPVNYSMYLEHRLRMYIIQSCVEYLVMPKDYQSEIDAFLDECLYGSLTNNIRCGLEYLSNCCPSFRLYPRMWQLFTYMMGGFILTDHREEEMELLSKLSGVPIDEVSNCFSVYDKLFPTSTEWVRGISNTHIIRLNFMPAPIMGIGANYRRYYYCDNKNNDDPPYKDLQKLLSKDYTYSNLKKWNKAAFNILKASDDVLKITDGAMEHGM